MMPENNAAQFHSVFNSNTTVIVCGNDMPLSPFCIHTCDKRDKRDGQLRSGAGESGGLTIIDGLFNPKGEGIFIGEVAVVLIFSMADKSDERREDVAVFGGGDSN